MNLLLDLVRWLIAVPAGLLFALCVLGNWLGVVGLLVSRRKPGVSSTFVLPFLGPIFGMIFLVAVPIAGLAQYWWIAPLIEPTWVMGLLWLVSAGVARLLSSRAG